MSLVPIRKRCPECKKTYFYNPDVGQGVRCPFCMKLGAAHLFFDEKSSDYADSIRHKKQIKL